MQHLKPQILGHSAFYGQIHLISEKGPQGSKKTLAQCYPGKMW